MKNLWRRTDIMSSNSAGLSRTKVPAFSAYKDCNRLHTISLNGKCKFLGKQRYKIGKTEAYLLVPLGYWPHK
jgi:hypothetical protein